MLFLGIESSCDETAAALIQDRRILAHIIHRQDHRASGGVIPQVAAREHMAFLPHVMDALWAQSGCRPQDLQGIGVTAGPGLVGGLLVGMLWAKGMACRWNIPLWPIHHLEAHGLMVRQSHNVPFPYGLLLLSGGHCLMAIVHGVHNYEVLGQTYDDAAGECIDKVARALGGPYPGGPFIESMAKHGNPMAVALPIPLAREQSCHFSFSGLKTACTQWIQRQERQGPLSDALKADFCASFQRVIAETLGQRLGYAMGQSGEKTWVISGGVAANAYFRGRLQEVCQRYEGQLIAPPPADCTDNGTMIAWATQEYCAAGQKPSLDFPVRPHWPLASLMPDAAVLSPKF
jgi:N6-L-threonylcarbamoyladenine synthase